MSIDRDMRSGSTTILVLALLQEEPMYGYQIVKELARRSEGYFQFKEGTLYPALHRLERDGLIRGEWRAEAGGPQRKYYVLTDAGRAELADSAEAWRSFSLNILKLLPGGDATPESAT
ncbi:MAG TPA: PadR family transcriptional regulator [Ardenticatenaceae bacterium]|nr:PadR family transcriptional regulator [Ardenticatenaceae bacterium]